MFGYRDKIGRVEWFMSNREGGYSTNAYQSLNLGFYSGDDESSVLRNREALSQCLGITSSHVIIPKEVHETQWIWVESMHTRLSVAEREQLFVCDALLTKEPGICIGVTTADCVPILLYDDSQRVVAAVHAGWKGVVKGILPKVVKEIASQMAIMPEHLNMRVNACISAACFEVGEEVAKLFEKEGLDHDIVIRSSNYTKPHIDLRKAIKQQAEACGVKRDNISISNECTYDNDRYFSARRDGFASGRMVSGIMLHP